MTQIPLFTISKKDVEFHGTRPEENIKLLQVAAALNKTGKKSRHTGSRPKINRRTEALVFERIRPEKERSWPRYLCVIIG